MTGGRNEDPWGPPMSPPATAPTPARIASPKSKTTIAHPKATSASQVVANESSCSTSNEASE